VDEYGKYGEGGYVYEFRSSLLNIESNLSALQQLGWIDGKTRAIFIQLTLYNSNVQLFTSVTFLVELLSTGLIIYLMIIEIRFLIKLKLSYFRQLWSLIDMDTIVSSWKSVGVHIWRYRESNRIRQLFKEKNGYVYINLQLAVYIDNLLPCLLSFFWNN
jgi:hypothetical protein